MASIDIDYDAIDREVQDLDTRRQNWLTALRSGEYPQVARNLYVPGGSIFNRDPGFCCLGVGAYVLDSSLIKGDVEKGYVSNFSEDYILVEDKYELTSMQRYYLMAMNDRGGVDHSVTGKTIRMEGLPQRNFKFIARWLEIVFALEKIPVSVKDGV